MALTAAAATVVPALPAAADTTITVTTTTDGGPGSLRAAITTANVHPLLPSIVERCRHDDATPPGPCVSDT